MRARSSSAEKWAREARGPGGGGDGRGTGADGRRRACLWRASGAPAARPLRGRAAPSIKKGGGREEQLGGGRERQMGAQGGRGRREAAAGVEERTRGERHRNRAKTQSGGHIGAKSAGGEAQKSGKKLKNKLTGRRKRHSGQVSPLATRDEAQEDACGWRRASNTQTAAWSWGRGRRQQVGAAVVRGEFRT
ncbi:hypothetical protein NDU88_002848 [Pleurodeles waltl]|uniref:Uncharacterized protein n=1 Tax=Pleurodeles waltl TaxID=8319 RepID=A0AAV7WME3_PLEWA|nr:hypothetical protein NDU88_002848 [Pleurodeles waltl]